MARNDGVDRTTVRNQPRTESNIADAEAHNERQKACYRNEDIVPERSHLNIHFKEPSSSYQDMFRQMEQDSTISTRGLKQDAIHYDELVFDVNSAYFHNHGGYEYAKAFYAEAYRAAVDIVGGEQYILSAVMHADERNQGMSKALGYYRDYFYYACKHRLHVDGKRCDYHHQWGEEIIDGAVEEIIHKLVNTPAFEQGIREKIGGKLDTAELDAEMETLRKQLRQLTGTKDRLGEQIDALDFDDPHYTRKAQDLQERQNRVYDQIASIEVSIAEVQARMDNIRQHRISTDNVYQFLLYFDKLYNQFTDLEKKTFMNSFIERVEIYPERQSDGRIVKRIEFRFPVYFKGSEISGLCWDETDMSETVMCFSKE